jgi:catechol 2,3-dioxygenase-like lactoylglutathione lyase family enzyme
MLREFPIHAVLPASDLERARRWYADKLDLHPESEDMGGLWYSTAGQRFLLTHSQFAGTAQNTAAEWTVRDLPALMADLRARGVVFEEYDLPGIRTVAGMVELEGKFRAAWFKDCEGNILGISEVLEEAP